MPQLRIRLLGAPEIRYGERPLSFRTRKVLALLIYLLVERGMHSRETLMALLWPETESQKAAVTMRGTLSRLRQALKPAGDVLVTEAGKVGLDFGAIDLDLAWLETAVDSDPSPVKLTHILEIDRGEFLEGFSLPDAPEYDTWAATQREACQRQVEAVYDHLTGQQLANHESEAAVETAARWVARAPLNEIAYRRLMTAQALTGNRSAALTTYARCQRILETELGIGPAKATTDLAERIEADMVTPIAPGSAATEPFLTPFVGRKGEHSQLSSAFRQTVTEGSRAAVVMGVGGVGKTRLLQAFREWVRLDTPEVDIWQGRAFETGGRLPYEPVIEALRLRIEHENAPEDLLEDVWLAELSQLMPELRGRYPDLPPPMTGDVNFVRSRLFAAIATLGDALAARRPVIFILDDVQWADPDTLDMVHYLARRWAESAAPILLVMTLRQENLATEAALRDWLTRLERDIPLTRMLLEPLSETAVQQLIGKLTDPASDEDTTRAFADWLWVETSGLPFFIEARLQMLIEQGILAGTESRYDFNAAYQHVQSLSRVPLPPGVRDIILARVARLTEVEEKLLLAAAVLGRESSYERLCQVAAEEEEAGLPALESLLKGRLLAEQGTARRPYGLAHDYIRTVVYDKSAAARRRIFHRRALIALEATNEPAAECAYHAVASLLDEPAFRYSLAAGDEAMARHALQESLSNYDQARDAAGNLSGNAMSTDSWLHLYQKRGRVLELSNRYEEAQSNYQEMLSLARTNNDLVLEQAALTAQCIIHTTHAPLFNAAKARELGQAALALTQETGNRELEARALWGMMLVEFYTGGDSQKVYLYGEQSLAIARELQLKERMGFLLSSLTWAYLLQFKLGAARQANSEALSIWRQLGNLPMLTDTYSLRLVALWISGDYDGLLANGPEALRLSHSIGNTGHESETLRLVGEIHCLQGRFRQALTDFEAAIEVSKLGGNDPTIEHSQYVRMISLYRRCGALDQAEAWADRLYALREGFVPVFQEYYLAAIAQAKIAKGDLVAGATILEQAFERLNREGSAAYAIAFLSVADGHLQLALGNPQATVDRMKDVIGRLRADDSKLNLAESLWLQGRAWLAMGQIDRAKESLLEARKVAEATSERTILWQILVSLAEVEEGCGDAEPAERLRDEAREVVGYIVEHAGELRETFLERPEVVALLN
ncbi:MAG TPA: AAA family ATPase [Anaerolineae bacterium]